MSPSHSTNTKPRRTTARRVGTLGMLALLGALATAALVSCKPPETTPPAPVRTITLQVVVAPSLFEVVTEETKNFKRRLTAIDVEIMVGDSAQVVEQIRRGRPVDVLIMDDPHRTALLIAEGVIDPAELRPIAGDDVLLVVPNNSTIMSATNDDLPDPRLQNMVMPNPETTGFGRIIKEALEREGLWETLAPRMTYTDGVRIALELAIRGEVDAALVGSADRALAGDLIRDLRRFAVTERFFEIAPSRRSAHPEAARAYAAWLSADPFKVALSHKGFIVD